MEKSVKSIEIDLCEPGGRLMPGLTGKRSIFTRMSNRDNRLGSVNINSP